jgi:hypothetical protein
MLAMAVVAVDKTHVTQLLALVVVAGAVLILVVQVAVVVALDF